jgi:hypothetical protein
MPMWWQSTANLDRARNKAWLSEDECRAEGSRTASGTALKGSDEESSTRVIDGQRVRIRGPYISRIGRIRPYYY